MRVPKDWEVQPIRRGTKREREAVSLAECGTCNRLWDDGIVTGITPAPSARCPFEYFH